MLQELGGGGATQQQQQPPAAAAPGHGAAAGGRAGRSSGALLCGAGCGGVRVVEWEAPLSGAMGLCQAALVEIMDALIKELRRTNKIDW